MSQELFRDQDATNLIGHVIYNRSKNMVQVIAGNCPDMGCVVFTNDPKGVYWIMAYGLRDSLYYNDITGMSARAAKKAIGDHPCMRRCKEKWLKEMIQTATS